MQQAVRRSGPMVAVLLAFTAPIGAARAQEGGTTEAAGILERMDAYTGHWTSDAKRGRDGASFHFEYDLHWMDEGRTIARMVITRVSSDGRTVIFEGYKGREPSGEGVYYVAASPSGRGARGEVVLEGDTFVTRYDGWTADGSVVEIRDVFGPVEDDTFVSRTFLRRDAEGAWRQVAGDRWTRAGEEMHMDSGIIRDHLPPDTLLVRPGDRAVDGTVVAPYEVVWVQYFHAGGNRTLRRTIVDRVERESGAAGGERLVRTQTFLGLDGSPSSERVNQVDGVTLTPLHERWDFRGRVTHVDYAASRVFGAMLEGDDGAPAIVFDEDLPEPGFDFNTVPLLLAALDLKPGLVIRFPHVRISPPTFAVPEIAWATIEVEEQEDVDAGPLGSVRAWRVVDPDHAMVFWIVPEAPYLVRLAFPIDDSTRSTMELGTVGSGSAGY